MSDLKQNVEAPLKEVCREEINGVQVVTLERETPDGTLTTSEGLVEAMLIPYKDLTPDQVTARIREKYKAIVNAHRDTLFNLVN